MNLIELPVVVETIYRELELLKSKTSHLNLNVNTSILKF